MASDETRIKLKQGDVIGGRYEMVGVLGQGGFSIVFLAYDRESRSVQAMKTFLSRDAEPDTVHRLFERETAVWVELGEHPFILPARFAGELDGRLFLATDFIPPDVRGCSRLLDHVRLGPVKTTQALTWAVQFCHGMEFAQSKGLSSHCDIKPANIFITEDRWVKIADFGFARGTGDGAGEPSAEKTVADRMHGSIGFTAPEVFQGGQVSVRSDIYSFGVVLWQMAAHEPAFGVVFPGDWKTYTAEVRKRQLAGDAPHVDCPHWAQIERCLAVEAEQRYGGFAELRAELEDVLHKEGGSVPAIPTPEEARVSLLLNRASGLAHIGRYQEAVETCDTILGMDSRHVMAWFKKGVALRRMKRSDEALACYDKALEIDPRHAEIWNSKGVALMRAERFGEALVCYDKSIEIDPERAWPWGNRGTCLRGLGRDEDAIDSYGKAIEKNRHLTAVWMSKGQAEEAVGRHSDAVKSYQSLIRFSRREERPLRQRAREHLGRLANLGYY
ncbi:MAG: tetratricopeptide repeat protein [Planctomycetes bacterium]|nr:tetratricopeptide repeat protein [Planctomycetota bacterium]